MIRLALAVFRLTVLFVKDDQPFFKWIRDDWAIWHSYWHEVLSCHRCSGIWAALIILLLDRFRLTKWIVTLLALAGAEMLIYEGWKKVENG